MKRVIFTSVALLAFASASQAQVVGASPYMEFGLGAQMFDDTSTTSSAGGTSYEEVFDFDTQFSGYGELGVKGAINPTTNAYAFIGANYSGMTADASYVEASGISVVASDFNGSLTSYYVGVGVGFELDPRMELAANLKLGGSNFSYDSGTAITYNASGTETARNNYASGDFSSFLVSPELKLAYQVNNQMDFVVRGNIGLHYNDDDVYDFDRMTTYNLNAGLRFNLGR